MKITVRKGGDHVVYEVATFFALSKSQRKPQAGKSPPLTSARFCHPQGGSSAIKRKGAKDTNEQRRNKSQKHEPNDHYLKSRTVQTERNKGKQNPTGYPIIFF